VRVSTRATMRHHARALVHSRAKLALRPKILHMLEVTLIHTCIHT